jgi:hypothetical protein
MASITQSRSEARYYERIVFKNPLGFKICSPEFLTELHLASSRNISQTGICFTAASEPPVGSIVKIRVELKTLARLIQIENMLFEFDNAILGKVIWTRSSEADPNMFDIGAAFIKAGDSGLPEVKEAIALLG